jgi:Uma2 family endonuclease
MTAQSRPRLTYAEYLEREATAAQKHDFINGEILAMAGGSIEHGALASAIAGEVRTALIGKPCRTFSSDVRVSVEATGATFYPDVSIACGKLETAKGDSQAVANPVVIVEVLSDSTEAYDRGAKAFHYRRLPSLKEYVLVSPADRRIEVQRLNERGSWELHFYGPGERVELTSLGISISVDAVYLNPMA